MTALNFPVIRAWYKKQDYYRIMYTPDGEYKIYSTGNNLDKIAILLTQKGFKNRENALEWCYKDYESKKRYGTNKVSLSNYREGYINGYIDAVNLFRILIPRITTN